MNTCSYCGAEYPDAVVVCPVDHTRLVESPPEERIEPARERPPGTVRWGARLGLCIGAWILVLIVVVPGAPDSLMLALTMLPFTTPPGFLVGNTLGTDSLGIWLTYGSGWLWFPGLTFLALRSQRRWVFWLFYTILCGSLLFSTGAYVYFYHP